MSETDYRERESSGDLPIELQSHLQMVIGGCRCSSFFFGLTVQGLSQPGTRNDIQMGAPEAVDTSAGGFWI